MYKKIIISLVAASVLSSAYAYEGHGFKIISTKVTSTPGFKAYFTDSSNKTFYAPAYTNAWASTSDVNGHPYEYIDIKGYHNINISNSTRQSQRYSYSYDLRCVDAMATFTREVELQPSGTFSDNSGSNATFQPTTTGVFEIRADTIISGADNARHDAYGKVVVR